MSRSWLHLVGWPVVGFFRGIAAPAVEAVVEQHAGIELLEIVAVHARQAERGGEQAGASGARSSRACIGCPHDQWRGAAVARCARPNSSIIMSKVQRSPLMAPERVLDIEGRGAEAACHTFDFRWCDEQEHGGRVDKAADEPGAGDAVDLGPRARHPDRAALDHRVAEGFAAGLTASGNVTPAGEAF